LRRLIGLSVPSPAGREAVGSRAAGAIEGVCWLKSANISCALPITHGAIPFFSGAPRLLIRKH
jgi:hypothetical protein